MELWIGILLLIAALVVGSALALTARPKVALERRRPSGSDPMPVLRAGSGDENAIRAGSAFSLLPKLFGREALERAGLKVSERKFIRGVVFATLGGALLGLLVAGPLLAVAALLLVPGGVLLMLNQRAGKRRAKFETQLTDTLQLLSGSLRAGHSILRAIDAAANESESPTADEMRRIVSETSLGRDLLTSLNDTAERMRNEDFTWVAQAIQINREVGGNLAEVLDQVNETIRERGEIKGHIRALAAEGKFSAYILVAMPFGIVGILATVNPGYMNLLFTEPLGWAMIAACAVLMTVGSLWLRKIIDLKF